MFALLVGAGESHLKLETCVLQYVVRNTECM